jgi:multidrug efflux pump subunit AcrB
MNNIIRWFVKNHVATNLIMLFIIVSGIIGYNVIGKIAFPSVGTDTISISVSYLGAGPREVEDRILIPIEEAVFGTEGVKRIRGRAREGSGSVTIEVLEGHDVEDVLTRIKARVDTINTFPRQSERPRVSRRFFSSQIRNMSLYGDLGEKELKLLGRQIRDKLAAIPGAEMTRLDGVKGYEISVEMTENALQKFDLTYEQVARAISNYSGNMPAGSIDGNAGQTTLVIRGQAYVKADFEKIPVIKRPDGTSVLLKDVATVVDGFTDDRFRLRHNGKNTVLIFVSSNVTPDVVKLSEKIQKVIDEEIIPNLPKGVYLETWFDTAEIFESRLDMLLNNGMTGLLLVFVGLLLFLSPSLAAWVTVGIAVSFLGCFMILPQTTIPLSMISLFSFILILGIVVDDAIIIGESIHRENQRGHFGAEGAIIGTEKVAKPVIISALTTMIFFAPMAFLPGAMGKIVLAIPMVVVICLAFSIFESLFILPSHLRHNGEKHQGVFSRIMGYIFPDRIKNSIGRFFKASFGRIIKFVQGYSNRFMKYLIFTLYRPFLDKILRNKLVTMLIVSVVCIWIGASSMLLKTSFFPNVTMNFIQATIEFPAGSPYHIIEEGTRELEKSSELLIAELKEEFPDFKVVEGLLTWASNRGSRARAFLIFNPKKMDVLDVEKFGARWRELTKKLPDMKSVSFSSSNGGGGEESLQLMLRSKNSEQIEAMGKDVKEAFKKYSGLYNISDSGDTASMEAVLSLKDGAANMGLSLSDLSSQIRYAFYGREVQRVARGTDTVKVMVRMPTKERRSFDTLNNLRIRTASGESIPFNTVADIKYQPAFTSIIRTDRERTLTILANAKNKEVDINEILKEIKAEYFDAWRKKYPDVRTSLEGDQKEQADTNTSMIIGFIAALFAIYALLAVAFSSYFQPFLILTAIPFAYFGAIIGHHITGKELSLMSFMGIIAASGVVVNDNLVLVDYINKLRKRGYGYLKAIEVAAEERFRPIFLTSFTTFIGLLPIMFETSIQAQFLIPTVVALAFGVAFATIATLIMVPIMYYMMASVGEWYGRGRGAKVVDRNHTPAVGAVVSSAE